MTHLLEVNQKGLFFQMGFCCNLIAKAVPIVQVGVGPYRMSGLIQALYLLPLR